jgi:hypothetical protein
MAEASQETATSAEVKMALEEASETAAEVAP